ncbi:hypothetical protein VB773_13365 [Haloarculaceae archaeon H-GB2-1]|nr:hypothetical protein [Haloarculaceae archaeon H-GB1-1]MEA5386955.1 hypothetical protein [Haloarculaceae archaeon H-GB11]MEA5408459.1 hypothetical protein [Haloarculaceae archaeon H-GB2-1]
MGLHGELRDAVENGRDEVVQVLASYKAVPVEVEDSGVETADLLGGGSDTPDFELEKRGVEESEDDHLVDRQTRKLVVEALGVDSSEECEQVVEELERHDDWGAKA